jgi:hypothetical protein
MEDMKNQSTAKLVKTCRKESNAKVKERRLLLLTS